MKSLIIIKKFTLHKNLISMYLYSFLCEKISEKKKKLIRYNFNIQLMQFL